jgi:hypothetical protein
MTDAGLYRLVIADIEHSQGVKVKFDGVYYMQVELP